LSEDVDREHICSGSKLAQDESDSVTTISLQTRFHTKRIEPTTAARIAAYFGNCTRAASAHPSVCCCNRFDRIHPEL
jgi:hypothetical protein